MTLKRFLKASALALSFVVSAPTVAHADPITAAIVTWAGFTAGTTAFAVATFVVNTALYAAGSWAVTKAAKALGLMKSSVAERQASVVSLSLGEVPREAVVGLACVGGSLIDAWNHGGKYGTDYTTRRVALADHVLDALVGYYVDDAYYAFTANGVQPGFSDGALQLTFANATAAGALPPLYMLNAGVGLTSADRTPSVAEIWITTKFNDQVWVRGHPTLKFVVRGLKLYDPRFDPQFGYTGPNPQTWEDVASHRFSDNAAVARYNIQRGVYAVGHHGDPAHLLIGRGLSQDEAPASRIIAAANVCDELVDGAPRYRVGGVVSSSQPHIEVEEMFAAAMAGQIVQRDGGVEVEPGQAKPAVVTITDDDLVAGEAISFSEFTPDTDGGRVNTVVSRYVEPAQLFKDHSGAVLRDQADIVEDGGPREMTLPLMLVTFRGQADRCAEIARRAARLERRATIPLVPLLKAGRAAAEIEDGDIVAWQSNRYHQGATVRYRVESYGVDAGWRNILQLREMASSVFGQADPVEDRASPPPPPTPVDALQLLGVSAEAITLAGEVSTLPAVRFSWDVETEDTAITAIRAEVRKVGTSEIATTRLDDPKSGRAVVTNGVAPDSALECRLVPIGDPSRPVLASNWITVSTSALTAGVGADDPIWEDLYQSAKDLLKGAIEDAQALLEEEGRRSLEVADVLDRLGLGLLLDPVERTALIKSETLVEGVGPTGLPETLVQMRTRLVAADAANAASAAQALIDAKIYTDGLRNDAAIAYATYTAMGTAISASAAGVQSWTTEQIAGAVANLVTASQLATSLATAKGQWESYATAAAANAIVGLVAASQLESALATAKGQWESYANAAASGAVVGLDTIAAREAALSAANLALRSYVTDYVTSATAGLAAIGDLNGVQAAAALALSVAQDAQAKLNEARLVLMAEASGSQPAFLGLQAGTNGGQAALVAPQVLLGTNSGGVIIPVIQLIDGLARVTSKLYVGMPGGGQVLLDAPAQRIDIFDPNGNLMFRAGKLT